MPDEKAFSYIRFSDPQQQKGDSLRRQVDATATWCERNGVALDTSLTLRDLGKSAFRGAHRSDKAALGLFLKAINQGKVPKGSYLVLENLDRLSREEEVPACHLLTSILMAGVKVVQLFPSEMLLTEQSNGWELMRAVMELSRGHGESKLKSKRVGERWEEKRKAARNGEKQPPRRKDGRVTESMTDHLPGWIEDRNGVLCLIPDMATAVHRVFVLAAQGLGSASIVRIMKDEKRPCPSDSGAWDRHYVGYLLAADNRRPMGEHQPLHSDGKPAGDPIPGYYPSAVTAAEWNAARAMRELRTVPRGRLGEYVNVFAGLLYNARERDRYYIFMRCNKGTRRRMLMQRGAIDGSAKTYSFDLSHFEPAVLSLLKEIKTKDLLGDTPGQEEVTRLSRELEYIRLRQDVIAEELLSGDAKALGKAARALDDREKELRRELDEATKKAAYPAAECWGETLTLIEALEAAPDPKAVRLRLQSLLGLQVEAIWVLVVPLTKTRRCCAVQVYFKAGTLRDYVIYSQGAGRHLRGFWRARSLATVVKPGDLDLRKPADAAALEQELLALDLAKLTAPAGED
jgi:DNA invertase Pin-like site-specific DNA recombinase